MEVWGLDFETWGIWEKPCKTHKRPKAYKQDITVPVNEPFFAIFIKHKDDEDGFF